MYQSHNKTIRWGYHYVNPASCAFKRSRAHSTKSSIVDGHAATECNINVSAVGALVLE